MKTNKCAFETSSEQTLAAPAYGSGVVFFIVVAATAVMLFLDDIFMFVVAMATGIVGAVGCSAPLKKIYGM